MKKYLFTLIIFLIAGGSSLSAVAENVAVDTRIQEGKFTLTSTVFPDGGDIPEQYTCKGADTNPPLFIHNPPLKTRSFVLTVIEPENPITPWTHWLVFNVDPRKKKIAPAEVPGVQALNDFGNFYYGGPCVFDAKKHNFVFTLYALNDSLDDLTEGATRDIVEKAMRGKVIDKAVLTGVYQNPLWGKEDLPL
jgi:Raf kinase inhibitor-like YbhB/YbcL family protein